MDSKTHTKTNPSPGLIVAVIALVVAMSGAAVALPGRGKVNGGDIKRNAIVSKHVKGKSLKGGDLRDETISSKQVDEDGLDPSDVRSLAIADDSLIRVTASHGANQAAARGAADELELYHEGDIRVYAKCFYDDAEGDLHGEIYAEARREGALMEGDDDLPANPGQTLLGPGTPEDGRQLDLEEVENANEADFDESEAAVAAPDGTFFSLLTVIGAKQGTLPFGNGAYGEGDVCLFGATAVS